MFQLATRAIPAADVPVAGVQALFSQLDVHGNGRVAAARLRAACEAQGVRLSPASWQNLMLMNPPDERGLVDISKLRALAETLQQVTAPFPRRARRLQQCARGRVGRRRAADARGR